MNNKEKCSVDFLIVNAVAMQTTGVGDYVYRVGQPSIAMGHASGVTVINVSTIASNFSKLCIAADILIVHLLTEQDFLPIILKRKELGRPTVYEVSDNFIALANEEKVKGWFTDPVNSAICFQYIQMADVVQVTGTGLQTYYGFLNDEVKVFENNIKNLGILERSEKENVIIGWGGSDGHTEDLKSIKDVITSICKKHGNVIFSFMGSEHLFLEHFNEISPAQKHYTPPGNLDKYLCFVQTLDIGIAPMLDTAYNRCRSDVKFLEYGSRGVAAILSDVLPYRVHSEEGINALLYNGENELFTCLDKLIVSTETRERIAENAYNYVSKERMEKNKAEERIEFYRGLCPDLKPSELNLSGFTALEEGCKAYNAGKSEEQRFLYDGILKESEGKISKAREMYLKSSQKNTEYYLPLFWLGYSYMRSGEYDEALDFLRKAIAINEYSLRSLLFAGKIKKKISLEEAIGYFDKAIEVSSNYAPAIEELGKIAEEGEEYEMAAEIYNSSLVANPFYSPGALALARVCLLQGDDKTSLKALEVARDIAPHTVQPLYQLAEFFFKKGEIQKCSKYCLKAIDLNKEHVPTIELMKKTLELLSEDEKIV